ncbi:MAG: ATP-binding cassette domain-containing protein [Culicoidibacterales bacterium]
MLGKYLKQFKGLIILSTILVILTVVAQLLQPQFMSRVLNDGVMNPTQEAARQGEKAAKKSAEEYARALQNSPIVQKKAAEAYAKELASSQNQEQAKQKSQEVAKDEVTKMMSTESFKKAAFEESKKANDTYLKEHEQDRKNIVLEIGVILIVMAVIAILSGIINTFIASRVAQGVGAKIRADAFAKVQSFGVPDIEKFSTNGISIRLTNDIVQIQNLILMSMQSLVRIPLLLVFSFIMAISLVPQYWWLFIVYIIAVILVLVIAMSYMVPYFGKIQKNLETVNRIIRENFMGIRVVKSFVQEKKEIEKVENASTLLTDNTMRVGFSFSAVVPFFFLIANVISILIFYLGVDILKADMAMSGNIFSVITYLFMIMMALIIGGFLTMTVSRAAVSIGRVKEIFDTIPSISYENNTAEITKGAVEFENVSFSYKQAVPKTKPHGKNEKEVEEVVEYDLENINFKVNSGEVIGIVGATGSGKTTLVSLIPRFYDATVGTIKIDGHDIRDIKDKSLHENISIVMQKALLFSGNIESNIKQGKLDATQQDVERAATIAQAKEFIDKTELGYLSHVEERGNNFSGGQKQRISMSRGFIKDPAILILDDSTSALDARSEKLVQEAIAHELENQTVFIVAQKISSVIKADKIIVLDEGKLVGFGSHRELLQTSEIYREIYDTQKGKEA